MITTALLNLLYGIIYVITSPIRLLSDVSLNSSFGTSIGQAGGYLHALNTLLPVDTMLDILGVSLAFELGYLTYKLIIWVLEKVPFIN